MRVRVTVGVWVRVWVSVRARAQIAAHPLHFLLVGLAQLHVGNGGVRVIERVRYQLRVEHLVRRAKLPV